MANSKTEVVKILRECIDKPNKLTKAQDAKRNYKKYSFNPIFKSMLKAGNHNEAVKKILSKGIANMRDKSQTMLHFVISSGNREIVKYLIEIGANVNAVTEQGQSCLDLAISIRDHVMLKYLLDGKAKVNAPLKDRKGVLCQFFEPKDQCYNACVVQMLLRSFYDNAESKKIVIDHLIEVGCYFADAASLEDIEILEAMLKHGYDVNQMNPNGKTALHRAVIRTNCELSRWLLDNNANPNAIDNSGRTPLQEVILSSCPWTDTDEDKQLIQAIKVLDYEDLTCRVMYENTDAFTCK